MVRKKLIQEIFKEIYGPRDGVLEKFSGNPFSEYLSGVLVPSSYNELKIEESLKDKEIDKKYLKKFPEDDDFESNLEDDYDNQLPSQLDPRFRTKSFGLSFILESKTPCLDICITWARYFEENECGRENLIIIILDIILMMNFPSIFLIRQMVKLIYM